MLRIVGELEFRKGNYNIGGSATAAAFGRGGVPPEVEIVNYSRGQEARDISGVATQVGFGRGGTPKETGYISYKAQEKETDERGV